MKKDLACCDQLILPAPSLGIARRECRHVYRRLLLLRCRFSMPGEMLRVQTGARIDVRQTARSKCSSSAPGDRCGQKMVLQLMPFPRIDGPCIPASGTDPAGDRECRGLSVVAASPCMRVVHRHRISSLSEMIDLFISQNDIFSSGRVASASDAACPARPGHRRVDVFSPTGSQELTATRGVGVDIVVKPRNGGLGGIPDTGGRWRAGEGVVCSSPSPTRSAGIALFRMVTALTLIYRQLAD